MPPVQLLHLTDPHLFGDPRREIYEVNTADSFRAVLRNAFSRTRFDAVIVTGDIAEDESRAAYHNFRDAFGTFAGPVLCLPGNHDSPATMAATLGSDAFQYCGSTSIGGWHIVGLDSHIARNPAGRIAPQEIERLEAALLSRREQPTLVSVHHPPVRVDSRWLDGVGLLNAAELMAVVARHPQVRGIVAGHVHQALDTRVGGLRVLTTPATCAQFLPHTEHCVMDQRPPAYRVLSLSDDGSIDTRVVWLEEWRASKPVRDTRQGPF
jgi:Icc protein